MMRKTMNLPSEANEALVDLMSAFAEYGKRRAVLAQLTQHPRHEVDLLHATVRDAEQALITIFTAVLGEPDNPADG